MHTFELKEIEQVKGKLRFYKLIENGHCEFDTFLEELKAQGGYDSEIRTIYARMFELSELKSLPENKFRELGGTKDGHKEYEIKTSSLRVYLFHDHLHGRIVVSGGKKTTQTADIKHFRLIKKRYFERYDNKRRNT